MHPSFKHRIPIEYRAYWPDRKPQPGMCNVIGIDFEDNEAEISNGAVRIYPDLNNIILMRYTGFKDKLGRKIFFDDVFYDDRLQQKFIFTEYLEVSLLNIHHWSQTFSAKNVGENLEHIEIVGNVHENKNLIADASNWDILIEK